MLTSDFRKLQYSQRKLLIEKRPVIKELDLMFLLVCITKLRLLTLKLTIPLLQFFLKGFQVITSWPILYFTTSSLHARSKIIAKSTLYGILLSDDTLNN